MRILLVGAGLANASLLHFIRKKYSSSYNNCHFDVIDKRPHIGGNCYTKNCAETGITIHEFGPHIFNTNSALAWNFINEYLTMHPYINRVKASTPNGIFSMPINLHTINQYYKKTMNVSEAEAFMNAITRNHKKKDPTNFEDAMLSHLGEDLYKEFIYGYTKKQWGVSPCTLPASIAKRLPFRLNYNDNYYNKKYQGVPVEGYTQLFEKIFSFENINLSLNVTFDLGMSKDYDLVFYTGTIDQFFDYEYGRLSYRTVYWERQVCEGYFQGNAVVNYTTENETFTRINEPIYFEPWKENLPYGRSVYFTEFSKATEIGDEPYYPIRRTDDLNCLSLYQRKSESDEYSKFIFHGRLGMYRYLDMDMVIEESSKLAEQLSSRFHG
jgi:UDP-galactopyranose mutase